MCINYSNAGKHCPCQLKDVNIKRISSIRMIQPQTLINQCLFVCLFVFFLSENRSRSLEIPFSTNVARVAVTPNPVSVV